jgi:predicted MPP superfamily phosphohydrolase
MKIMSIGDIHGRNQWKHAIFGSIMDYENWRREADNGIHEFMADQYPTLNSVDKIVFVGDYVDSFDVKNPEMKLNLEEIIHLKRTMPEKVVLLLGNHDIQYIVPNQICSGYRPEMKYDFEHLFRSNLDCFQAAYYHETEDPYKNIKRTLWTHAGVTQGWLTSVKEFIESDRFRHKEDFKDMDRARPDEIINKLWEYQVSILFNVDSDSGGMSRWAGPMWVRPRRLSWEALEGYDQVVGHTPQRTVKEMVTEKASETTFTHMIDTIFLIDCLEHGDGTVLIKNY